MLRTFAFIAADTDRVVRLASCLCPHSVPSIYPELYKVRPSWPLLLFVAINCASCVQQIAVDAQSRLPPAIAVQLVDLFDTPAVCYSVHKLFGCSLIILLCVYGICSGCKRTRYDPRAVSC